MFSEAKEGAVRERVIVVDDDDLFRESLQQNLSEAGFEVAAFSDGPSLLRYLGQGERAALILLDWRMPGMNGIEVLRRLREAGETIPVIFLTALSDQMYEEAALIGGAVDFVEKSRSFAILLRRIELIMRGPKAPPPAGATAAAVAPLRIGPLELRVAAGRVSWKGVEVPLTLTEFNIVRLLAERPGRDVRYREIYDVVRGSGFVAGAGEDGYRANVRAFIKRIRQKFREVDDEFDRIENYAGFGYRWRTEG
jgi:two-component system response regulator ChvI